MKNKVHCIHHNDMDGRAAGAIVFQVLHCLPDDYKPFRPFKEYEIGEFKESDYNSLDISFVNEGDVVYIVDYSFTEKTYPILKELLDKCFEVIWIDHHDSSIDLMNAHEELREVPGIRSKKLSGAALTYVYTFFIYGSPNEEEDTDSILDQDTSSILPLWIHLVSDYDTWTLKENTTMKFKLGVDALYDITVPVNSEENMFYKLIDTYDPDITVQKIIKAGSYVESYVDNQNSEYRNSYAFQGELNGTKVAVINYKKNSSVFGHLYEEYPAVVGYVFDGEKYQYSIYSRENGVDCRKIAEMYGGGGHRGAAGFISKHLVFTHMTKLNLKGE